MTYGYYYVDYNDSKLLGHMQGKGNINVQKLKDEYATISALSFEEATKDSPLKPEKFEGEGLPQSYYVLNRDAASANEVTSEATVKQIIGALDSHNRWLVKHAMISNPYIGKGQNKEPTDEFASTYVGDKTDTSPYRDPSDMEYISTPEYIKNMNLLISYVKSAKKKKAVK